MVAGEPLEACDVEDGVGFARPALVSRPGDKVLHECNHARGSWRLPRVRVEAALAELIGLAAVDVENETERLDGLICVLI